MNDEARELARAFFRKWSTQALTASARKVLEEDAQQMRILFDIYGEPKEIFDGAEKAPNREWFGERFNDL